MSAVRRLRESRRCAAPPSATVVVRRPSTPQIADQLCGHTHTHAHTHTRARTTPRGPPAANRGRPPRTLALWPAPPPPRLRHVGEATGAEGRTWQVPNLRGGAGGRRRDRPGGARRYAVLAAPTALLSVWTVRRRDVIGEAVHACDQRVGRRKWSSQPEQRMCGYAQRRRSL